MPRGVNVIRVEVADFGDFFNLRNGRCPAVAIIGLIRGGVTVDEISEAVGFPPLTMAKSARRDSTRSAVNDPGFFLIRALHHAAVRSIFRGHSAIGYDVPARWRKNAGIRRPRRYTGEGAPG
jgi:hypothetical protein